MKDCVFCKIVAGEIPRATIYEDKRFLAIMDAFPALDGQFLVIPKKHTHSKFTEVSDHVLAEAMLVAKKVAKHVDSVLNTWSCVVIEGMEVPHYHIRVYPVKKGEALKIEPINQVDAEKLNLIAEKLKV